jgi:assimilatory nitrate reductase catalytic subunit
VSKRIRVAEGKIQAARLYGETVAANWLLEALTQDADAVSLRWMLSPMAKTPAPQENKGRVICSCIGVFEADIGAAITGGADLVQLQKTLKCGTECGSCVPELKRRLAECSLAPKTTTLSSFGAAA